MPNVNIFKNQIEALEKKWGIKIDNIDEVISAITSAWEKDKSQTKVDFLQVYANFFWSTVNKITDKSAKDYYLADSDQLPKFGESLKDAEKSLKLGVMALIPELRKENKTIVDMTFGALEPQNVQRQFISTTKKYADFRTINNAYKEKRTKAYDRFKGEWQASPTRNITEVVYNKDVVDGMEREDKITYLLALDSHLELMSRENKLGEVEKDLCLSAIKQWKVELGYDLSLDLEESVGQDIYKRGQELSNAEKIRDEISAVIKENEKETNPRKRDVERYNSVEAEYIASEKEKADKKRERESTVKDIGITDDMAEAVGDMFTINELETEINDKSSAKEKAYLHQKVEAFNQKYSLKVNSEKLYTSISQLSTLLVLAQEEKQKFLDEKNVVVIEDGKETVYNAKKYFKDKNATGGLVIVKENGETRRYKASEYYEVHETLKEQYAYSEYQATYERCYKYALENEKELSYQNAKPTNLSIVAKDVDDMFKSAMFVSRLYDNPNNRDIVDKCSFGGFTAEQLSNIAMQSSGGAWGVDQKSDVAWKSQCAKAKSILHDWNEAEKSQPKFNVNDKIASDLKTQREAFASGEIDKKALLDYVVAADAHKNKNYDTFRKKFFGLAGYLKERNAIEDCRKALGMDKNKSLKTELSNYYAQKANMMSKDVIFNTMTKTIEGATFFDEAKVQMEKEHNEVKEKIKEEKRIELERIRESGRERIEIPELDERLNILNQQPRSPQIQKDKQAVKDVRKEGN